MKKFLRLSLLSLFVMFGFANAMATQATFDFDNNYATIFPTLAGTSSNESNDGDFTESTTSAAIDGVTITVSPSGGSNANRIWSTSPRLRAYGGTITVNGPSESPITAITFTLNSASSKVKFNLTANVGTLTHEEKASTAQWTGSATSVEFTVGGNTQICSMTVTYGESSEGETPSGEETTSVTICEESFASDQGTFTIENVTMPSELSYVWSYNSKYTCMKASAFVNSTNYETESWLISPIIDLTSSTKDITLSFEHAGKYFGTVENEATLWVREEGGEWQQLTISNWFAGWDFVETTNDLTSFAGKKIQVGFKYTSTSSNAGTWEVKNFKVTAADGKAAVSELQINGDETFSTSTTVTIVPTTSTGIVYYTTDGTDPATSSNPKQYTEPFTITETTTVKAVEYDETETDVIATGEKTFTKEASGAVSLPYSESFGSDQGAFTIENVTMPSELSYVWNYNSQYTCMKASAYVGGTNYEAESWLISPVIDMTNASGTITMKFEHAGKYFGTAENEATLWIREEGGDWNQLTISNWFEGWTFVEATNDLSSYAGKKVQIGFKYNSTSSNAGTWEVKNFSVTASESGETPEPSITEVASIAEFLALDNGTEAKLTLTDAKVLYSFTTSNGNNSTYLRDATGAICLYNSGIAFENDQDVNGTITMTRSSYNNLPQGQSVTDNSLTLTAGSKAEAKSIQVTDAANYLCDLVELKDVTIGNEDTKYYAYDSDQNKVQIYNGFHLTAFDDLSTFVSSDKATVKGIMVVYKSTYEIYPIEDGIVTGIENLKANTETIFNGKTYNVQGQKVGASYKGIVIKNGKKIINTNK